MSGGLENTLRLRIDAGAAESGSRAFTGALAAIKRAVRDLDRDTTGAFASLRKGLETPPRNGTETALDGTAKAATRAEQAAERLATSVKTSMTTAGGQAAKLRAQFESMGNTSGIERVEAALARLQSRAGKAGSAAQLGTAKADYRDAIAGLQAEARAQEQAASAAAKHAASVEALRKRHDEVFAVSKRYEASLEEIAQLEASGALTAEKAATARARAAQQLAAGAVATGKYGQALKVNQFHVTNFNNVIDDMTGTARRFDMRQVSMQLSQVAQQGAVTGDYLRAFMVQLPDLALGFGPVGIAAGAVAGVLGTVLVGALEGTSKEAEKTKNKVHVLSEALDALEGNSQASAAQIQQHLNTTFKSTSRDVQALIEDLKQADFAVISHNMRKQVESVTTDMNRLGGAFEVFWADFQNPGSVDSGYLKVTQEVIAASKMTYGEFEALDGALKKVFQSKDVTEFIANLSSARKIAGDIGGPIGDQINKALLQAAKDGGVLNRFLADASGETVEWSDRMQGVLSTINAIKASLGSIGGGIISNAAKEAELKALREGKSVRDASVEAQRFQKEAEWKGRSVGANWGERQLIEMERAQFERGLALDSQLDDARSSARTAGGGRAALTASVERTIAALQEENTALEAQRMGLVTTDAAARMYAEAMLANGGHLTEAQMQSIAYADSLELINQKLRETQKESGAAGTGLSGIGKNVSSDLSRGISQALQGGSVREAIAGFASSVQRTIADKMAEQVVSKLGIDKLFNVGATTGAATMQAAIVSGSAQGAAMYAQAISTGSVAASAAGGSGTWLTAIGSFFGFGSEGGISGSLPESGFVPFSAFKNAPHYAEGTANTSNGIPSILHPNEAVIPLSRGRKVPVELGDSGKGGVVIHGGVNASVTVEGGDDSPENAARIAAAVSDGMRAMIETQIAEAFQYGGTANPRGGFA